MRTVDLDEIWSVVIVGGGAAGLFAASKLLTAAPVLIIEKGKECGRKLLLTGGERCNLTHDATVTDLLPHYHGNPHFLMSALNRFDPVVLRSHFQNIGVPTVADAQGRVFPRSRKASDVRDALLADIKRKSYKIMYESEVTAVGPLSERTARWCLTLADGREVKSENVIFAGGGASYPGTGSNGKLCRVLNNLNIASAAFSAALTDLRWADTEANADFVALSGLSMKNVSLGFPKKGTRLSIGDLLITHRGLSGPAAINIAADLDETGAELILNLFPALNADMLLETLLKVRDEKPKTEVANFLGTWLPSRFAALCCDRYWPTVKAKRVADLSLKEWRRIAGDLTHLELPVLKKGKLVSGMVSRGGIKTAGINPKTMELKGYPGLFVCGEMLDIDGDTGGYNLQAAFSTACAAADSLSI